MTPTAIGRASPPPEPGAAGPVTGGLDSPPPGPGWPADPATLPAGVAAADAVGLETSVDWPGVLEASDGVGAGEGADVVDGGAVGAGRDDGLCVGRVEAVCVGRAEVVCRGVALAVGLSEAVGAGVVEPPRTMTVPLMNGCTSQWYAKVPATANVALYDSPGAISPLPLKEPPSSGVTVCCSASSFVHAIESPIPTVMVAGA